LRDEKKLLTYAYFLSFIALGLVAGATGPSIPSFAENTGSALNQVSSLFVFSSMGYVGGSFISGFLYQKFPGNRILVLSLVLMAIGIALLPVIHALWILVAVIFVVGITQSHIDVGENALMVWLHGSQVAPYMNGLHFFFGLGSFTAPLIIAQSLLGTEAINLAFWIFAVLIIVPVPFLMKLESPKSPEFDQPTETRPSRPKSPAGLIVLLVSFFLFFTGAEITYGNWIYTHGLKSGFATIESAAYLTSVFWGTFLIGRLLGVILSKRFTTRQIIWFDLIGGFFVLISMLVFSDSALSLWVGTGLYGLFIATGFPTGMNLAEELNVVTARITSLIFISSSVSVMVAPWIVGQFIEKPNNQALIWVVLVNLSLAIAAMSGIQFWKRPVSQEEAQPSEILPRSISTD